MAKPQAPGMGRGLEAILSVSAEGGPAREEELRELPVELIVAEPQAAAAALRRGGAGGAGRLARRARRAAAGARAAASRGARYELVAGERRWRAAQIAGLADDPALVREREDAEALELALIENMAREDLNPIEEARACAALVEELGLTREEVGRRVGRGRVAVSNLVRLLDLPDEVIELLEDGALSEGHGRALLLAEDHGARAALARSGRRRRAGRCGSTEARARESNARSAHARPIEAASAARTSHPDQEQAATGDRGGARRRARGRGQVTPSRDGGYRAELSFATPRRRSSSRGAFARGRSSSGVSACGASHGRCTPLARIGARGRLAQLVRALL